MRVIICLVFLMFGCALHSPDANGQTGYRFPDDAVVAWDKAAETLIEHGWSWQWRTQQSVKNRKGGDHDRTMWSISSDNMEVKKILLDRWGSRPPGSYLATVINDEYAFKLKRKSKSDPWVIDELYRYEQDSISFDDILVSWGEDPNFVDMDHFFFYARWLTKLRDLLAGEGFRLHQMREENRFGQKVVVVEFSIVKNGSMGVAMEKAEFVFDPQRMWMLLSWRIDGADGGYAEGTNSDIRSVGHGVYVAFDQTWDGYLPGGKHYLNKKATFESYRIGPTPRHEFSLSAFGIPEISDRYKQPPPFPWFRYTLIGGGVAALIIGFWLKRK